MVPGIKYTLRLERTPMYNEDCDEASYKTISASYFLSDDTIAQILSEVGEEYIANVLFNMLVQRLRDEAEERSKLDGSRY